MVSFKARGMLNTQRQQQAAERILEDPGLTNDLTDAQARPLIDWASSVAARIASDTTCSDDDVDMAVGAVRRAVLYVADAHVDEQDATQLVLLARQKLLRLAADQGQARLFNQIMDTPGGSLPAGHGSLSAERRGYQGPSKRSLWQAHRRQLRMCLVMRRRPRRR